MVKESACQCRGNEFHPRSGKISHATEQLTLCVPPLLQPRHLYTLCGKRSRRREKPAPRREKPAPHREQPLIPTSRERPSGNKDPAQQKIKQKNSEYRAAEFFKKTLNWVEMERKAFIFHNSEKLTHIL